MVLHTGIEKTIRAAAENNPAGCRNEVQMWEQMATAYPNRIYAPFI